MRSNLQTLVVANLTRRIGGRAVVNDVSFSVAPGQVTCLLGPSGCGKSTTLRMIAGAEVPNGGRITSGGRTLAEGALCLPPEKRGIGLLFQDFALFPHLDVRRNVAFGLPRRGRDADQRVREVLARVDLEGYAARFPHELSGGEQQRVALARALAPRPRVMLLDEPFSGLDNRLRDTVRDETLAILREEGTAVVMVTHDPFEAMQVADEIALMRAGRIVQIGAPAELYEAPADKATAAFFSEINVLPGRVRGGRVETELGLVEASPLDEGSEVDVVIRPHHLRITAGDPAQKRTGETTARAVVTEARFLGDESLLILTLGKSRLKARVRDLPLPRPGDPVSVSLPRQRCFVFPRPAGVAA